MSSDSPSGNVTDDSYKNRPGDSGNVPVQSDDHPIEDPIDAETADSDAQLERDERDAIDKSNIIDDRTRGAAKEAGTYAEPGDEEGLPGAEDGTSSGRQ